MQADEVMGLLQRYAESSSNRDNWQAREYKFKALESAIRALCAENERLEELRQRHFALLKMTDEALDTMTAERDSLKAELDELLKKAKTT
jgi:hypothetical protein